MHLHTHAAVKVLLTHLAHEEAEQFRWEAQTVAHLTHPHIVRVLDFDVAEGVPFLVMDYAPNGTLRQHHARGVPLPLATVVEYVQQIAGALQHAHKRKVIHRDVKPENLLLEHNGEVVLSDFGIAVLSQSSDPSYVQQPMGTPTYMAPEQIQGKPRRASDQYALGVIVYEWLTGFPPFQGTKEQIIAQHLQVLPPPLHDRIPTLSPDIEHVVLKALAKEPQQRFANVEVFARALEQANAPRNVLSGSPTEIPLPPGEMLLFTYHGHTAPVHTVAWSPDGRSIASAGQDQKVRVWEASTGRKLLTYRGHDNHIHAVAWSPNGKRIASASADRMVRVWDAATGETIYMYTGHSSGVSTLAWSPDGKRIASAGRDGIIHVWNPVSPTRPYYGHTADVQAISWSPDGTRLASASSDRTMRIWDVATGSILCSYHHDADPVKAVTWSPDGMCLAFATGEKVRVVEDRRGNKRFTYRGHNNAINAVVWSPDGKCIASASFDRTVQMWSAATGTPIFTYRGHGNVVNALAWSPDGSCIASASDDCTVHVWRAI